MGLCLGVLPFSFFFSATLVWVGLQGKPAVHHPWGSPLPDTDGACATNAMAPNWMACGLWRGIDNFRGKGRPSCGKPAIYVGGRGGEPNTNKKQPNKTLCGGGETQHQPNKKDRVLRGFPLACVLEPTWKADCRWRAERFLPGHFREDAQGALAEKWPFLRSYP